MHKPSSKETDEKQVKDILESIKLATKYCSGISEDTFLVETHLQDAVARRLTIIGEAASRLSEEFRQSLPEVPWRMIMGMRNLLVHDYGRQNARTLWTTVKEKLLQLKSSLARAAGEGHRAGK